MSFTTIKSNASARFNEVQMFLNYITSKEPNLPTDITPLEVKIMRGLFYVHLYSAVEKTVNEIIQHTLLLLNSKNIKNLHLTVRLNAISNFDKVKSLKDCSYKSIIPKSTELFESIVSRSVVDVNETMFANSLQNIWVKTIEETASAFGVILPEITPRCRATIDEIVDKRNAVAHGRETASYVGERHRTNVLRIKMQLTSDFIFELIDSFESFYDDKLYLKPQMKRHYA